MRTNPLCAAAVLIAGLLLADPGRADVRELSTDRPDLTESPFSVPRGWIQLELDGVVWTRDEIGSRITKSISVLPVNLKFGLTDHHDLQIVYEPWIKNDVEFERSSQLPPLGSEYTRSGELAVRLKWNLLGNDGGRIGLGLLPWFSWNTDEERSRFAWSAGAAVPVAIDLAERVGFGAMAEVSDFDGGWGLLGTATLALDVAGPLGAFGEIVAERVAIDQVGGAWNTMLNGGVTVGIGSNAQLDGGVRLGVSEDADDVALFVGFAARRPMR